MAIFNWTTLSNNQTIAFNPLVDVLNFNDATISASELGLGTNPGLTHITAGNKTVTLQADRRSLTTTNVTFSDGSLLVIGDNTTGITTDDGPNTLIGGPGADRFYGLGGDDEMFGGAGNDVFTLVGLTPTGFPWDDDTLDGGEGFDELNYATGVAQVANGTAPATVNLATGVATSAGGTTDLVSIEVVWGTAGNDTFIGGDPAHGPDASGNTITERFIGRGGNDSITGGAGIGFFTVVDYSANTNQQTVNVNLASGIASDGVGGTDTLKNIDSVRGTGGNDTLLGGSLSRSTSGTFFESFRGNGGNDIINGNNGLFGGISDAISDRADYANNTKSQAISVNLKTGIAFDGRGGTDTLIDIDQVYGGDGNDTIVGNDVNNQLDGGEGNDKLDGGEGSDEARYQQSTAGVIVNLGDTAITVNGITVAARTANDGMGGTDTLISIEQARGSDFNDYLRGSDSLTTREFFTGDAGNDTFGGGGIDYASYANVPLVFGGIDAFIENGSGFVNDKLGGLDILINIEGLGGTHNNDILRGGLGDQFLRGRGGSDTLDGGPGSDWATYGGDPAGVTIDLGAGTAEDGYDGPSGLLGGGGTDSLISIENAQGSDFDDTIIGSNERNELEGRGGNDAINGLSGADTAVFRGARADYDVVETANGHTVTDKTGADGTDTLSDIERLRFSDVTIAVDLDPGQSTGNTVRLIGAAFDSVNITPELVGIGVGLFDAGFSMLQVAQLALGTPLYLSLANSNSNEAFVNTVYRNLVGTLPSDADRDFFVSLLQGSGGTMTQAELLVIAANSPLNTPNINLVGLQESGVELV